MCEQVTSASPQYGECRSEDLLHEARSLGMSFFDQAPLCFPGHSIVHGSALLLRVGGRGAQRRFRPPLGADELDFVGISRAGIGDDERQRDRSSESRTAAASANTLLIGFAAVLTAETV